MEEKKSDRRIRKTEAQLLMGLTKLMQEKSINDITVRELADIVDINRSTFYLHYKDIYDMIEQTEAELIDQFTTMLNTNHERGAVLNETDFKNVMISIFEFLLQNRTICKALLGPNGDIKFLNLIIDIISQRIEELLKNYASNKYTDTDLDLVKHYFVSGCIGLVQCWLDYDSKTIENTDPEHMANLFLDLIKSSSNFI